MYGVPHINVKAREAKVEVGYQAVTKIFIKNKEIMNKSAVFRLTLSFPNVSGLALHQWNYQFIETVARLSDL